MPPVMEPLVQQAVALTSASHSQVLRLVSNDLAWRSLHCSLTKFGHRIPVTCSMVPGFRMVFHGLALVVFTSTMIPGFCTMPLR